MKIDGDLRKLFRARLPLFDFCTIELGVTGSGAPDMNYCCDGIEGWIEAKACDHWKIKVRAEQVGWVERRLAHGGRVHVAVRRYVDELWMFHGSELRTLKHQRLDVAPRLGRWFGGPSSWNWEEVASILIK